jgi:hypothetical protein
LERLRKEQYSNAAVADAIGWELKQVNTYLECEAIPDLPGLCFLPSIDLTERQTPAQAERFVRKHLIYAALSYFGPKASNDQVALFLGTEETDIRRRKSELEVLKNEIIGEALRYFGSNTSDEQIASMFDVDEEFVRRRRTAASQETSVECERVTR